MDGLCCFPRDAFTQRAFKTASLKKGLLLITDARIMSKFAPNKKKAVGRIMAIDYGTKRTGVAVTDPMQMIASPLETVPTHDLMNFLDDYMKHEQVDLLVVGEPRQMDATASETLPRIRFFAEAFKKRFKGIPVEWVDERFTTRMAMDAAVEGGMKKSDRRKKGSLDKISAAIILQAYLEGVNKPADQTLLRLNKNKNKNKR